MKRAELTGLNNHLDRLEKNLVRVQAFQEKGCAVDSSLNDIYSNLREIGDYLEKIQTGQGVKIDKELEEITEKHRKLTTKFESITNEGKTQAKGMILASENILPNFFYLVTSRNRRLWKIYEFIATLSGIGIICFSLFILTYFFVNGNIPLLQSYNHGVSGLSVLGFIVGIILGLIVHEFAHGIVLANNGIRIKRVGAVAGSIVGGFVEADEDTFFNADRKVHLRFNASSIGTNALIALIMGIIGIITSSDLLIFLALGNLFFGFINSLPISPLDGGWVYEDMVNIYLADKRVKEIFLSARFVIFVLWIVLFVHSALMAD